MGYDSSLAGIASMVAVLLVLTSGTLILRLVARSKQKASFGIDDILAILAFLTFLGSNIVAIYTMAIHYTGFKTPNDPAFVLGVKQTATQAFMAGLACAIWTLGFTRLSAVFFFRRIFCTKTWDTFDIFTKILIFIIPAWTIGMFLLNILACGTNVSIWWSPGATSCLILVSQRAIVVSSFILDFLVLILPLPKIWQLHTTPARKVAISAVFLMALSGLAASLARMLMLYAILGLGIAANRLSPFEANTRNYFYQLLEQGACLTAVNLPSIWYFVRGLTPEKVLRSFRSFASLRSTGSQESVEKNSLKTPQNGRADSTNSGTLPSKRAYLEYVTETQASE